MNIEDLKISEAREIAALFGQRQPKSSFPYEIGEPYFIRTVTHHYTGRLKAVYEHELVLSDVAWIADDGRFANALAKGEISEIEPYPDDSLVIIGRGSIIDAVKFNHKLPRSQK